MTLPMQTSPLHGLTLVHQLQLGPLLLMHVNLILTTTIITMAELYPEEDMSPARPLPILPLVDSWLRPLLSSEMYNVHYL